MVSFKEADDLKKAMESIMFLLQKYSVDPNNDDMCLNFCRKTLTNRFVNIKSEMENIISLAADERDITLIEPFNSYIQVSESQYLEILKLNRWVNGDIIRSDLIAGFFKRNEILRYLKLRISDKTLKVVYVSNSIIDFLSSFRILVKYLEDHE